MINKQTFEYVKQILEANKLIGPMYLFRGRLFAKDKTNKWVQTNV